MLSTLSEWLTWISSIHDKEIELGLDRVKQVATRLNLLLPKQPVIIVGGTNGKGSTVQGLASIYQQARYQVGTFTTPYLFKHNEQVRINGICAQDEDFCQAFAKVAAARGNISLTPFEFNALAALLIFQAHSLDVLILEVGLGGRLDAVNIIDADVSIITSIDLDHMDRLGDNREAIGFEKAGIMRKGKPTVSGDLNPPQSLADQAKQKQVPLFQQGKEFFYLETLEEWSWFYQDIEHHALPLTTLATQNMSSVLMAITLMQNRLPVSIEAIKKGLACVTLPARVQVLPGKITEIFDVSHNPAAILWLAKKLSAMPSKGKTYAVFSMLTDKDMCEGVKNIRTLIDYWYVAPLKTPRASSMDKLQKIFHEEKIKNVEFLSDIEKAYDCAHDNANVNDRIIIFGSFHTIDEVTKTFPAKREILLGSDPNAFSEPRPSGSDESF